MVDYRAIMALLFKDRSYRQIVEAGRLASPRMGRLRGEGVVASLDTFIGFALNDPYRKWSIPILE